VPICDSDDEIFFKYLSLSRLLELSGHIKRRGESSLCGLSHKAPVKSCQKVRWVVTIPVQYKWCAGTAQAERQIMQTNTQANVANPPIQSEALKNDRFRVEAVPPGSALLVGDAAVFNVAGGFCATQAKCTHRGGPLNEGKLEGSTVTCPWHGTQYNVCTGAVLRGPATEPAKTYRVVVEGKIGRVEKEN
jgi:nitrite reductase/ring-hydroxylating ferredoxin subunit